MFDPYPPNYGIGPGVGSVGPPRPRARPGAPAAGYPVPPPVPPQRPYPGPPPAPLPYPPQSPRRSRAGWVAALLITVALAGLIGYTVRGNDAGPAHVSSISTASAKAAIQNYLDALADRDFDAVARNTLCGIYDEVSDHRADNAVARMSSDAFRKQFSQAEVTSVDKIVYLSDFQAQALFTMRANRVSGDQRLDRIQGLAQLLSVDGDRVLVCSYVLRAAGTF